MKRRNLPVAVLGVALLGGLVASCQAPTGPEAEERARYAGLAGRPQARSLTCESRSAADLLAAHGLHVSEEAVFARMPRSDNPDLGFVGDPDGPAGNLPPAGYGVHAEPVASTLRSLGLDARAERGRDLAWLDAETAAGRPVIVWVTGSCDEGARTAMTDRRGRPFVAVAGEHVVLVVAVRGSRVRVLDPATGGWREFPRAEFDAAWALFERAAVSASGPLAAQGG